MSLFRGFILGLFFLFSAQTVAQSQILSDSSRRVIVPAVQFLLISPDSRGGGMGDTGAATSPDANSHHWNPSKLAFMTEDYGASISYTPWLGQLVNDMWIMYLSGYKKLSDRETIGMSLRYFSMGQLLFTNNTGQPLQEFNPNEFALDATYARQLSPNLSIAGSARFIYSNLAGNVSNSVTQTDARPGTTVAVDLSTYYQKPLSFNSMEGEWALGANISNVGGKISYNNPEQRDFIPANLRIGTRFTGEFDEFNKLSLTLDANKLLVPTPLPDGSHNDKNLISSVMGSFGDAPDGVSEEIQEVMLAVGAEYWYNDIFALRGGYFYEHENKGNRKYFTVGVGLRYQVFAADFSYLIPTEQNNPLQNTMRFTLYFNFNKRNGSNATIEGAPEGAGN